MSGTIRVRDKGENKFHVLSATESIPVGSSVDATKATVRLFGPGHLLAVRGPL